MPETIRNILRGASSIGMRFPGRADKSVYVVRLEDRRADFANFRRDMTNVCSDVCRAVERSKEVFRVR